MYKFLNVMLNYNYKNSFKRYLRMNKKTICFIFARGGSKGLPKKNVLTILGKPLIVHSIRLAKY